MTRRKGLGRATRASTISNESIGLVGVGGFATALGSVVAGHNKTAVLYSNDKAIRREINAHHRNPERLPGVSLAKRVAATGDAEELARLCELIIVVVPSLRVEAALRELAPYITDKHIMIHGVGGLIGGQRRVSQVMEEVLGTRRIVALAGPALPRDLSARRSCALVAAGKDDALLERVKVSLQSPPVLRIYKSHDLLGVELASAVSSALTVVMGVADGFGVGDGPRTVLLTRAVAEGARVCAASGAKERTFYGMAGLGNLLVRASPNRGVHSKDYAHGLAIGRESPSPYESTEGSRSLSMVVRLGELLDVDTPICTALDRVVQGELTPDVAADLLGRVETDLE